MKHVVSIADVLLNVFGREKSFPIIVGEFEHEFFFQHVNNLHVIQRIQAEIFEKMRLQRQLLRVDFVEKLEKGRIYIQTAVPLKTWHYNISNYKPKIPYPQHEQDSVCDERLGVMRLLVGEMRGESLGRYILGHRRQIE